MVLVVLVQWARALRRINSIRLWMAGWRWGVKCEEEKGMDGKPDTADSCRKKENRD